MTNQPGIVLKYDLGTHKQIPIIAKKIVDVLKNILCFHIYREECDLLP